MENDDRPDVTDDIETVAERIWEPEDVTEQQKIEKILADVEQGWRVSIYRLQPTWCRGLLETIDIPEPDFRLDLNDLISRWGGQRLHVKVINEKNRIVGGGTISLFSYPPLRFGEPITDVDVSKLPSRAWNLKPYWDPSNVNQAPPPQSLPAPAGSSAPSLDLTRLLEMMQQGNRSDLELALKLIDRQNKVAPPTPPPSDPSGMLAQMMGMMKMFKTMQDLFGGGAMGGQLGGAEKSDEESILPMIGDIIKGVMGSQSANPQPHQRRQFLTPPKQIQAPPPIVAQRPSAPDTGDDTDDNLGRIADKLARLEADDAVDVVLEAMGNMPMTKREEAMQKFVQEFLGGDNEEDDLDESSITQDTFRQDEHRAPHRPQVTTTHRPVPDTRRK